MAMAVHFMPQPCPVAPTVGGPSPSVPTLQLPVVMSHPQFHAVPSSARTMSPTRPIPTTYSGARVITTPSRHTMPSVHGAQKQQPWPSQILMSARSSTAGASRNLLAAGNLVSERNITEETLLASGNLIRDEAAEAALMQQLATVPGAVTTAAVTARGNRATPAPKNLSGPPLSITSAPALAVPAVPSRCSGNASGGRTPRRSFTSAKLPLASRNTFNTRSLPGQTGSFVHVQQTKALGGSQQIVGAVGPEEVALPDDATTYADSERGTLMQEVGEPSQMTWTTTPREAVRVYTGFTEHTYRLVFPFEDRFAPDEPLLFTIVPSGVVENSKMLEPKKEKGLITFAYPQSISDELTKLPVGQQTGSTVDSSTAKDGNNQCLCDTAFVWRRQDGTNALVQTWPTNLNEKFRQDFEISEGANPDSAKFQHQAVSEFKEAMVRLFGPAAASCPIQFCHKKLVSTSPAVVGHGEEVLTHIKEHPDLMRELAIASIDSDSLGFVADGTNGKGQKFEKNFRLTPGEQCVVYRKTGWDTMGSIKPLHQFLSDAEFHEPPALGGNQQIIGAAGPQEVALPNNNATCMDSERGMMMQGVGEPRLTTSSTTACEVLVDDAVQADYSGAEKTASVPLTGIAARIARAGFRVPGM